MRHDTDDYVVVRGIRALMALPTEKLSIEVARLERAAGLCLEGWPLGGQEDDAALPLAEERPGGDEPENTLP